MKGLSEVVMNPAPLWVDWMGGRNTGVISLTLIKKLSQVYERGMHLR